MSSDWSEVRLGSHVDLLTGFPFKSSGFTAKDGVRLLRGDNVAQGVLRWDGAKRWPEAELDGLERYLLKEGDVIVAMDRPWIEAGLKYAQVSHLDVPSLLVQRVARLRSGLRLEQTYLRYLIGSPEFVRYVLSVQTGTAVPHISAGQIGAFRFMLPSLDEQRRIASVLGALDRKIQHNRRLATTAGHLVGTMFSHACLQLPTDGQAPLTSIADFKNGGAFTKHANGVGRPIIRIKELNDGVGDATPRTDHAVGDQHIARHDDLLFSWSGSLDVYRWDGPESIINQHIFKVIPREGVPTWFVEWWLRHHLPEFQAIARDKVTTMGHIKRHHLDDAVVAIPKREHLAELDAMMRPLDDLRGSLRRENRRLSKIRDALLPRLVSGQIRVPESYDPNDALGTVVELATAS